MTNPQPHIPTDGPNAGVPLCQSACPHYLDYEYGEECELGGIAGDSCIPCLPAVRQMAAKLRSVRELAERKKVVWTSDVLAILNREEMT